MINYKKPCGTGLFLKPPDPGDPKDNIKAPTLVKMCGLLRWHHPQIKQPICNTSGACRSSPPRAAWFVDTVNQAAGQEKSS